MTLLAVALKLLEVISVVFPVILDVAYKVLEALLE
jgi:hypothetical protein